MGLTLIQRLQDEAKLPAWIIEKIREEERRREEEQRRLPVYEDDFPPYLPLKKEEKEEKGTVIQINILNDDEDNIVYRY